MLTRHFWGVWVCVICFCWPALGDVLFQSASINSNPGGGLPVLTYQWPGVHFTVTQRENVTSIGGQFIYDEGSIFGVIVQLSGPNALPPGSELDGASVLAETTFTPPASGNFVVNDYQTPLGVTLTPGNYGLVFGTGLFGATGTASLTNNTSIGTQSYFDWYPPQGGWVQGTFPSSRFVIDGTVPEPGMLGLVMVGAAVIFRRRRGR